MEKIMQDMNRDIKHCVAESTALGATTWAEHIFSVEVQEDCDNGVLCTRGDYIKDEVYVAADYEAGKPAMLILNPPLLPFDNLKSYAQETSYYNGKGEHVRAYVLKVGDRYTLSDVIFDGTPEPGKYVTFDASTKMYSVVDAKDESQFCAKILTRIPQSNVVKYKLLVESL
jgi:hypothetical protein